VSIDLSVHVPKSSKSSWTSLLRELTVENDNGIRSIFVNFGREMSSILDIRDDFLEVFLEGGKIVLVFKQISVSEEDSFKKFWRSDVDGTSNVASLNIFRYLNNYTIIFIVVSAVDNDEGSFISTTQYINKL